MNPPVMTQEVALQVEQAKADSIDSWLQGIQEKGNTSSEITLFRRGNVRAFATHHMQAIGLFNRVIGFGPHNTEYLQEVIQFYQECGIEKYAIEINPYHVSSDLLALLTSYGFSPARFETYLYGVAVRVSPSPSLGITVREITASEVRLFSSLHVEGYQEALAPVPEVQRTLYRESLEVLYQRVGWHFALCV